MHINPIQLFDSESSTFTYILASADGAAVIADTSPKEAGGLSGALFNMFGNIAGITTPIVIGYIVQQTGSFSGALVFVGANAAVTIFSYVFIVGEIKRVKLVNSIIAK